MKYLKNPFILYGVIVLLFISNGASLYYFLKVKVPVECPNELVYSDSAVENEELAVDKIYVDIKGYVKKPGVYELDDGAIVNDLIKLAGGLKSNGTTENINLSKKLTDEMMVIVSSKKELNKISLCENVTNNTNVEQPITNNATTDTNVTNGVIDKNSSKISLNTATQEQLMTLSGIGEKTALKIIEYRNTQKFNSIEDIKKVSGIGDSIFENIKDFITI